MKKYYFLLLALTGCGQTATEHQATSTSVASKVPAAQPKPPVKPVDTYASGDREVSGPNDTLHVGNGLVLQLKPGSKSDFAKSPATKTYTEEASYLKVASTSQVRRYKHTLYLTLKNGKKLKLINNTSNMRGDQNEDNDTWYYYLGSLPQLPYWQVDSTAYETNTILLINRNNGSISRLWNHPLLSPDKQYIIVQSQGVEMAPNGIQLFEVSTQKITLKWERVFNNWEPQRIQWLDNYTIAIERSSSEPKESITYVRLSLPH